MPDNVPRLPSPVSPSFSFECFPPRTDKAKETLAASCVELAELEPEYFSVTFGAGGSTRVGTARTVADIRERTGCEVAPHISCIGAEPDDVLELLNRYREEGVRRIVALRGDVPSGVGGKAALPHASDLVSFIRKHTGDWFHIEVACYPEFHPEAPDADRDLANFHRKVEAGADVAITQYFFNADAYFRFVEQARNAGIEVPIVAGVMPITNFKQLARFSDACGAEIPRWIRKRLETFGDDLDSLREFGADVVTDLCGRLLEGGAPGIHFYTLNKSWATRRIWKNLGLANGRRS